MKRYYFDLRDGDALAPDEEGLDLSGIEAAQVEAAGFLVDVAKNAVLGSAKHGEVHNMAIEFPVFTFGQIAALTSGNLPTMKRYYFDLRDGDALGGARWKRPGPDSEAHV